MAAAALQEGEVFANRYRIVRELASGGMGAVYEVIHTVTERRCALKVMLSHTVEREQLRKRFMQESRLAAQIGSEYIVDVLDAGVDEETKAPYLVMELLEGEDLGQRLLRQGALAREEAVGYLWHVALALDRTHQAGIVHRDLKASNLFLTRREDGTPLVKVLDFGVAKVLTMERSGEQRTQTVGTPIYMAPEQFRAEGRISASTDIYALGMLAYTLLVGVHYWTEEHERCENPFAFASIAVHGPKEEPSLRAARERVTLPAEFDGWFFRATSRWPQDRFPSATAAVAELARSLGVEVPSGTNAPTVSLLEPKSVDRGPAGALLPATLEAPSERLARPIRTGTPSGPSVQVDPVSSELGRDPQHTEVSLSVTSGGLPFVVAEPKPQRNRAIALGAGIALGAAVVALGVGLSLYAGESHEVVKSGPAATGSTVAAAATTPPPAPATVKTPEPPTALSALPTDDTSAMTIDQLPIDRPGAATGARPADDTRRGAGTAHPRTGASSGGRTRPVPEEPAPRPSAPAVPGGGILRDLQSPSTTKAVNRESTWGRD